MTALPPITEYKLISSAQGPITCAAEPSFDPSKILTDIQLAALMHEFKDAGADCRAGIKTWADIVKTWPPPEKDSQPVKQTWWQRNFGTK